jgi:hypothetical protein
VPSVLEAQGYVIHATYLRAVNKARRLFPGPIAETLVAELESGCDLHHLLGPHSLCVRLLDYIEALPDPRQDGPPLREGTYLPALD